jgi:hypothetical protein
MRTKNQEAKCEEKVGQDNDKKKSRGKREKEFEGQDDKRKLREDFVPFFQLKR